MTKNEANEIEVLYTEAFSQHDKAIYEAGKTMLVDSIRTGRDFCQFMITTSTGAIPVYLAILTFLLPKNYSLGVLTGLLVAGPAVIFLIAAFVFALGYFPIDDYFSLNIMKDIEDAREKNIRRRKKLATYGFIFFVAATLYAIGVFILKVGTGL